MDWSKGPPHGSNVFQDLSFTFQLILVKKYVAWWQGCYVHRVEPVTADLWVTKGVINRPPLIQLSDIHFQIRLISLLKWPNQEMHQLLTDNKWWTISDWQNEWRTTIAYETMRRQTLSVCPMKNLCWPFEACIAMTTAWQGYTQTVPVLFHRT